MFSVVEREFRVVDFVARGEVDQLADALRTELARGNSAFSAACGFEFMNTVDEVRAWLERCARLLQQELPDYPGLYSEMNGFDINPDRWFASLFAWTHPIPRGVHPDEWEGGDVNLHFREDLTLLGAEAMQDAFLRSTFRQEAETTDQELRDFALAQWLVWSEWLSLLSRAWQAGPILGIDVPLVATAHDFDVVLRLEPSQWLPA